MPEANHHTVDSVTEEAASTGEQADMFPEFEELRRQIAQRIRDNQRFLERVFDEDSAEDEDGGVEEEEFFEEL